MKKTFTSFVFLICTIFVSITTLNAQTYFTDDFENGLGNWIVGGNNWDTLSTTYTSQNHCITDSRIGNYTINSNPIITMSSIINLTNATLPVLTFFHRYNLRQGGFPCGTDNIYVEISTNGGFNWSTLRSQQGTNTSWTFVQISLINFRNNLVKIRFNLSAYSGCEADGWYIDDVKILENSNLNPPINLPFSDNFENGLSKWVVGGFSWDTTTATFNSSTHSATDSRAGNYNISSSTQMRTNGMFNLSNTVLPVLTFFHRYNLRQGGFPCGTDYIYVYVSTNGGFNWIELNSWVGTNLAWTFVQIDLSSYRTDSVKILFELYAYSGCNADGWYIDDVTIRDLASGVAQIENSIPEKYSLNQNYPNPFNPITNIEFSVPKQSNVKINVYDSQGKEVAALLNEKLSAGTYRVDFDGTGYSSGVYFYKMETEDFVQTRSMVILK